MYDSYQLKAAIARLLAESRKNNILLGLFLFGTVCNMLGFVLRFEPHARSSTDSLEPCYSNSLGPRDAFSENGFHIYIRWK
eukprot:SAG31_NODE_3566_length_4119_cov_2.312935_4_plen_81_part_00